MDISKFDSELVDSDAVVKAMAPPESEEVDLDSIVKFTYDIESE